MTPEDAELGRLVAGTLLMVLVAIGFGVFIGCQWMKEKYELWSEDELKHKLNSN